MTDTPPAPGTEEPDSDALIAGEATAFEPDPRHAGSAPLGAHAINWRLLSNEAAQNAWNELRPWVEWFILRYRIPESTIPACWWKHGQLVEELSALYTAHIASFDSTDTGYGPIGWHERLSLALPRLTRAYAGGCSTEHREIIPRSTIGVTDEQEWDAWTKQAHAH